MECVFSLSPLEFKGGRLLPSSTLWGNANLAVTSSEVVVVFSGHRGKTLTAGSAGLSKCARSPGAPKARAGQAAAFLLLRSSYEVGSSVTHCSRSLCRELALLCH